MQPMYEVLPPYSMSITLGAAATALSQSPLSVGLGEQQTGLAAVLLSAVWVWVGVSDAGVDPRARVVALAAAIGAKDRIPEC